MKTSTFKPFIILLAASFLISCATTPHNVQDTTQQDNQNSTRRAAPNSAEREILFQGALTGAAIGGALAGGAAYLITQDKLITALAAAAGTVIGGAIGSKVAKDQIQDLRDVQLKNDQLEMLLTKAREYNSSIASYNNSLEQEIIQLKEQKKTTERTKIAKKKQKEVEEQRVKLAQEKLKSAEEQRTLLTEAVTERQQLSATLVEAQKKQYQETLNDLNKEGERLDGIINELKLISGQVRIG